MLRNPSNCPISVEVTPDDSILLLASVNTSDGGFYTCSLGNPAVPTLLGHSYHMYPNYLDVAYSSETQTAFLVSTGGYFQAFDITNPATPVIVSDLYMGLGAQSVVLSPDQSSAFVSSQNEFKNFAVLHLDTGQYDPDLDAEERRCSADGAFARWKAVTSFQRGQED